MSIDSTKDKIVQVATDLVRTNSYNSISYKDISDAIGIKKASIHYHFQTKELLGIEIMQKYRSKIEYLTKKLDKQESDPVKKLEKYFDFFSAGLKNRFICPAGVFSVEYNTLPIEIQQEVRALFNYYMDWLTSLLQEGKEKGVFQFEGKPTDKALYIASTIEGALILARSFELTDHFTNVTNQVRDLLMG